jgi:murein DD-endopeptidase MepM/ murein hydrolase activator NlpD
LTVVPTATEGITAPVPADVVPVLVPGIITYTVQAQDSLASIAERFGLQRETVVWANELLEADPGMLGVGQVLTILPVDGVYHTVREGETLAEIAEQYAVTVEAIAEAPQNGLGGGREIVPGDKVMVPGGVKLFQPYFVRSQTGEIRYISPASDVSPSTIGAEHVSRGEGPWLWPVVGDISQGYWNLHRAVDIAGDEGDVIVAADSGVVVYAEWEISGYGYLVVVDHKNGYVSYYGHLYGFYVEVGQPISRGGAIGVRGDTGRSTGPHLHFEIRHHGVHVDPFTLLPDL